MNTTASSNIFKFNSLPNFQVFEFRPKSTKYCFIPIVYNEGDRFRAQIRRMSERADLADIIVAARESNDGCVEPVFLREQGVQTLLLTEEKGSATAIRMGFWYALSQGYEGIVLIDGHNKDGVEAIPDYLKKLDEGWDFIQGSRFIPGGFEKHTPFLRKIGIRLIMAPLLWIGGGFWYTDGTNGFRGYSRRLLEDSRVEPFRECFSHFNLQYYLSYIAPKLKYRVVEIPVSRVYPDDGQVPTKVVGFRQNFMAFWEMVRTVFGKYDAPLRP
jgi:dolichol-phosphate mannosyltransferase